MIIFLQLVCIVRWYCNVRYARSRSRPRQTILRGGRRCIANEKGRYLTFPPWNEFRPFGALHFPSFCTLNNSLHPPDPPPKTPPIYLINLDICLRPTVVHKIIDSLSNGQSKSMSAILCAREIYSDNKI